MTFTLPQFSYCPLMQMFHRRNITNRVRIIHARALKLVYDDGFFFRFWWTTKQDILQNIHQRNLQFLETEIFKMKNEMSSRLKETFFSLLIKPNIYEITRYC